VDYLWSPWRYRYIAGKDRDPGCVFCRIGSAGLDEDGPNLVVLRGDRNFVVLNRFPYSSGHLMVVPYEHASELSGIDDAAATEMMALARRAERALRTVYRPGGINMGMNLGECAGAGIAAHIHLHVVPRWNGDANFMSVVGETRVLPEELDQTLRRLRPAF
jgi:ATP adenylyltransferase